MLLNIQSTRDRRLSKAVKKSESAAPNSLVSPSSVSLLQHLALPLTQPSLSPCQLPSPFPSEVPPLLPAPAPAQKTQLLVLLLVKRICRCCSDRHLGQSITRNLNHLCMKATLAGSALDKGNLLQSSWPLLGKVKTAGQDCDFHGSCTEILCSSSCVFVTRHILLTKGFLQDHSVDLY